MVLDYNEQKALTDLKRKRGVIKASLTRVRTFVTKFDPSLQAVSLLEFRQEELPQINRKFDDVQSQIELLAGEEEDSELERDKFEQDYFAIRSQIQELISLEKTHNSTPVNASFAAMNIHRAQLPPIPLPKFNGNIQEWASFFDVFRAMVHNDENYTAAQKFFYLRSCLEGPALELVRSIPISDGNYEAVIGQLVQRYDNHSLVIQSHIRSILDCPRVEESRPCTLQALYSTVSTHIAALRSMDQPVDQWDAWLITIVTGRLDRSTAHGWQLHQRNTRLPKYSDLEIFIASRCTAIETSAACTSIWEGSFEDQTRGSSSKRMTSNNAAKRALISAKTKSTRPCPCCSENHRLFMCEQFKGLSISERINTVRTSQLCFNCLAPFHSSDTCRSKYTCLKCKQKHNTLLHYEKHTTVDNNSNVKSQFVDNPPSTSAQHSNNIAALATSGGGHVFLSTASVLVEDNNGQLRKCRVILDNGSQMNFMSKSFARLLQLPRHKTMVPVSGIGAGQIQSVSCISIKVKSRVKRFEVSLVCHVLPIVVDGLPSSPKPASGWDIPEDLIPQLADPFFDVSGKVDLLIGGGVFFDLFEPARVQLPTGGVCLQDSKFGWVVTGEMGTTSLLATCSIGQACDDKFSILCNDELETYRAPSKSNKKCIEEQRALKHFEETGEADPICLLNVRSTPEEVWEANLKESDVYGRASKANRKCLEEEVALQHFKENVTRDAEGRFVLRLPIKPEISNLGDSLAMATSRFINVERRLQRDDSLRKEYTKFMDEYVNMGHMQEVMTEIEVPGYACYLPHHPVFKLSSLSTKTRVVFDASAKTSSGVSLNDVLMRGPTVQEDIFSILTRFRKHQYVITADIEKMFRQIMVAEEDRHLQRILWRSDQSKTLKTYELATVTYGTTPASFMATQCLVVLGEEARDRNAKVSEIILRDFYMDDLITGCDSEEECCQLTDQITIILNSAKLPLRKWCSNSEVVLAKIGKREDDPLFTLDLGDGEAIKSLGLCWKPVNDEFQFNVVALPERSRLTKRSLLSDLNKVFDPLGFLVPVLIKGKIFLQQLWQLKTDWDVPLSEEIQTKWKNYHAELGELGSIVVPRKVQPTVSKIIEVHGFSDASIEAYGACIFIRTLDFHGRWHARLLCSKSRVAPLKGATIPRLELSGALLLAQLAEKVAKSWNIKMQKFRFWTDSMVVLAWMNSHTSRLKTFVANRVNQILEITDVLQWQYVNTGENPADIISRGMKAQDIKGSTLWWNGPPWLESDEKDWNLSPLTYINKDLPEVREVKLALVATNPMNIIFNHYSDWNRMVRGVAWLTIYLKYLRKVISSPQSLRIDDLNEARKRIIRMVQAECFSREILSLEKGQEIPRSSKLRSLNPFMRDGLILVGGRLENSNIADERKHPVVLPAAHKITKLIFEKYHRELLHGGPQLMLSEVRRLYWPLLGRITARAVVRRCVKCTRARPHFDHPVMAALPRDRVKCTRPFTVTGVDFAGPIYIRSGLRRVAAKKAWIAIFVCFSTKAMHLELTDDLSSQSFMATLRCFMARRGKCAKFYSDNGTNFVGAQKELVSMMKKAGVDLKEEGIEWHFNPPSAPHFGGIWESAVKSTKHHLRRVMSDHKLTSAELRTLLCQIEACLNSRPMTPLNSDPSDLAVLTPAHFLIGGPMLLPDEPDISKEEPKGLRRWQLVQNLMQTFWKRWSREYLPQIQIRGKWTAQSARLSKGDVVIIKDDCMPPARWKLGLVEELHTGSDGVTRVVTLRTACGMCLRRPVVKLCRLPIQENEISNENVETIRFQRGEDVQAN